MKFDGNDEMITEINVKMQEILIPYSNVNAPRVTQIKLGRL